MKLTVISDEGGESVTADSNITKVKSAAISFEDLRYVMCEMITPYPMANMTPVVSFCLNGARLAELCYVCYNLQHTTTLPLAIARALMSRDHCHRWAENESMPWENIEESVHCDKNYRETWNFVLVDDWMSRDC